MIGAGGAEGRGAVVGSVNFIPTLRVSRVISMADSTDGNFALSREMMVIRTTMQLASDATVEGNSQFVLILWM